MPLLNNMVREMRNRISEAVEKPLAKGSRDHYYTKDVDKFKIPVPPTNPSTENIAECKGCQKSLKQQKRMECGFCETAIASPVLLCPKVLLMLYIVVVVMVL